MKFKRLTMILLSALSLGCHASPYGITHENYTLDVFKSRHINAAMVDNSYHNELKKIADILLHAKSMPTRQNQMGLSALFDTVMNGLYKTGAYAYLGLSPVTYPGGGKIGFTVDVVDTADKWRMEGFLPKPVATLPDPGGLIQAWLEYEKTGYDYLLYHVKNGRPFKSCPAFHCLFGFESDKLKPFAEQFSIGAIMYQQQLIQVLREDKDEIKRGAAAYLLAHLSDANEVVKALSPSMRDSSHHVRNNVMRVLAQTAQHAPDANYPVDDAIRALTYPTDPDRNKALYMLETTTVNPKIAAYVKQHGCRQVMDQYRTVQPNLHGEAYNVLVNISKKHYPIANYMAWENWARQHCA